MANAEQKKDAAPSTVEKVNKAPKPVTNVEHKNIYAALAAFQGENPEIKRTKQVKVKSRKGEESSYEFWYAPLPEILLKIRPLLARHGLSFVHKQFGEPTGSGNYQMVCEVYHETRYTEDSGVIRSMPITVKRSGDMKDVGGESTYARRYTLCEVLGIAADDDNDVAMMEERTEKLENHVMRTARARITNADDKTLTENANFVDEELLKIKDGKPTSLGLTEAQYLELRDLAVKRRNELNRGKAGKGEPGENSDNGGNAQV